MQEPSQVPRGIRVRNNVVLHMFRAEYATGGLVPLSARLLYGRSGHT